MGRVERARNCTPPLSPWCPLMILTMLVHLMLQTVQLSTCREVQNLQEYQHGVQHVPNLFIATELT